MKLPLLLLAFSASCQIVVADTSTPDKNDCGICVMERFEASYTTGTSKEESSVAVDEGEVTIRAKPCSQITVKVWGKVDCTWTDVRGKHAKETNTSPEASDTVFNNGYDKQIESITIPVVAQCSTHQKEIVRNVKVVLVNDTAGGPAGSSSPPPANESLHWGVSLGYTTSGTGAGRLRLDSESFSRTLLSPKALRIEGFGIRDKVY